ncbi:MAG: ankyrin repeat domain-containing protein, partial [Candidatus Aminicenantes bacterium]|nr:ankyrin repeat domain-containing protein [Candidatus Aminicenantes bacterium]
FAHGENIFQAIAGDDDQRVAAMLAADPSLANARNQQGLTALHVAVAMGKKEAVRRLLDMGALANCGDGHLRAPIHYANWRRDRETIDLLLAHGAVIDTRAIGGASPLIHASLSDDLGMCGFLIDRGADIHIQCNALTTPLYFAVLNGNLEYMDRLLKSGAEIDVPDFLGRTPLQVAVRDGNREAARKLLDNGADLKVREASTGRTLLHIAALRGHVEMIRLLLDRGLDPRHKDGAGVDARDLAQRYGNRAAALVLNGKAAPRHAVSPATGAPEAPGNQVVKLQNGGWAVVPRGSILVLGYSETGAQNPDRSLANGHITAELLSGGRKLYCIDPEFHGRGKPFSLSGNNPVFEWPAAARQVAFVLNPRLQRRYEAYGLENRVFPAPGETVKIGGLKVTVLKAYEANLCYRVEMDNLEIVWLTGICDNYLTGRRDVASIQALAELGVRPDILFIGTPSGIGPEIAHGIRESFLAASALQSRAVFVCGHEPLERKVRYQLLRKGAALDRLHTASAPGDRFILK